MAQKRWPYDIFLVNWLGYGRRTEFTGAVWAVSYGIILLILPAKAFTSPDIEDLAWIFGGRILAAPFLLYSFLCGLGLFLNLGGFKFSRPFRFLGGLVGVIMWTWICSNLVVTNHFGSVALPITALFAYFSAMSMGLASANLPVPGSAIRQ